MNGEQFRSRVALKYRIDEIRGPNLDGLADAEMAGLAAVDQVNVHQMDLLDADVEVAHVRDQPVDLRGTQSDQPVGHQRVTLRPQPIRLGQGFQPLGL